MAQNKGFAFAAAAALLVAGLGVPAAYADQATGDAAQQQTAQTTPEQTTDGQNAGQNAQETPADGAETQNGQQGQGQQGQNGQQGQQNAPAEGQQPAQQGQQNAPTAGDATDEGLSTTCPLPVTNRFTRDGMDFTVTTNCPKSGQFNRPGNILQDVPAVLFSNVISQGGQNYTYSYENGESKTSYLYASADGALKALTVTGDPEYALIQNGDATDVKVVNHLAAGDVQLKSTELFTVTTQGNLRHTVTFSNEGTTPLTGTLRQTLDTDLNGDDYTTLYANGQGNVYITSHDFTLTAEKLDGTATLYAGSWGDPNQVRTVDGFANGTKVAEGLDTAIYYETGALNLQPGQSTTMAYQETVYKAGEYVPGIATRTLSFDTQGGSAVAPQRVPLGSVTTKPADPTRAGYTFAGWTTDKEGKNAFKFGEALPEDLTIYAQWKKAPAATTPKLANTGASVAGIAGLALAGLVAGGAALAARRRRD